MQSKYWPEKRCDNQENVWVAISRVTNKREIIKYFPKRSNEEYKVSREAYVMKCLYNEDPKHFLKMIDFIDDTYEDQYIIAMERAECSLENLLLEKKFFTEEECIPILKEILLGMKVMHKCNYIHRDLKLSNILLMSKSDYSSIKIIDFGETIERTDVYKASGLVGTVNYMAPEILKKKKYGKSVDIWSIGVITYRLLTGKFPYYSESDSFSKHLKMVKSTILPYIRTDGKKLSPRAVDFIKHFLELDPLQRISLQDALEHPFLDPDKEFILIEPQEPQETLNENKMDNTKMNQKGYFSNIISKKSLEDTGKKIKNLTNLKKLMCYSSKADKSNKDKEKETNYLNIPNTKENSKSAKHLSIEFNRPSKELQNDSIDRKNTRSLPRNVKIFKEIKLNELKYSPTMNYSKIISSNKSNKNSDNKESNCYCHSNDNINKNKNNESKNENKLNKNDPSITLNNEILIKVNENNDKNINKNTGLTETKTEFSPSSSNNSEDKSKLVAKLQLEKHSDGRKKSPQLKSSESEPKLLYSKSTYTKPKLSHLRSSESEPKFNFSKQKYVEKSKSPIPDKKSNVNNLSPINTLNIKKNRNNVKSTSPLRQSFENENSIISNNQENINNVNKNTNNNINKPIKLINSSSGKKEKLEELKSEIVKNTKNFKKNIKLKINGSRNDQKVLIINPNVPARNVSLKD